jgi:RNA recognition motif-containing protein
MITANTPDPQHLISSGTNPDEITVQLSSAAANPLHSTRLAAKSLPDITISQPLASSNLSAGFLANIHTAVADQNSSLWSRFTAACADFYQISLKTPLTNHDLSSYGTGIKQYYKLSRYMIYLFLICTLAAVPTFVENILAFSSASGLHLSPHTWPVMLSVCSIRVDSHPRLFVVSFCMINSILFLLCWWKRLGLTSKFKNWTWQHIVNPITERVAATNDASDKPNALVTASTRSILQDYTVMVTNLPRNEFEVDELALLFKQFGQILRITVILGSEELLSAWSKRESLANSLAQLRLREITARGVGSVTQGFASGLVSVASNAAKTVIKPIKFITGKNNSAGNAENLEIYPESQEESKEASDRNKEIIYNSGNGQKSAKEQKIEQEIAAIDREIMSKPRSPVGCAFITFSTEESALLAQKSFHSSSLRRKLFGVAFWLLRHCGLDDSPHFQRRRLVVKSPPGSSDLLYWNLYYSEGNKLLRRSATFILAGAIGYLAFLFGILVRNKDESSASSAVLHYCIPIIMAISKQVVYSVYRYFSEFEKHSQISKMQQSLLVRIFLTQVLTSVISTSLVVLYAILGQGSSEAFTRGLDCKFTDDLVRILIVSLGIEILFSPLMNYLRIGDIIAEKYMNHVGSEAAVHQISTLPYTLELHSRYLTLLWLFFLVNWFGIAFPVFYLLGFLGSLLNYAVDKYNLLRVDRYIPRYDAVIPGTAAYCLVFCCLWQILILTLSGVGSDSSERPISTTIVPLTVFLFLFLASFGVFYAENVLAAWLKNRRKNKRAIAENEAESRELTAESLEEFTLNNEAYIPNHPVLHQTVDIAKDNSKPQKVTLHTPNS